MYAACTKQQSSPSQGDPTDEDVDWISGGKISIGFILNLSYVTKASSAEIQDRKKTSSNSSRLLSVQGQTEHPMRYERSNSEL